MLHRSPSVRLSQLIQAGQTVVAPVAALIMASLLFVYSRTSIRVAKANAQKHREADGGQISWRNESLRRHGALEKPEDQEPLTQLVVGAKDMVGSALDRGAERSGGEEKLRAMKGKRREKDA